ncbi:hypothetical protein Pan44_16860 [Caulifigura coniformis]|uniref:DUF72 domain-containing protein n=1 Tax=Caulifigura coniformis TaxID=2527983 RepID=A0A517SC25_9PLAN|nr:DUF72 domain-containing protein [Caulifigura coniformis]QDT53663.1 hypothetical protein Pan44_16860 [Caulifigura coniformis]
MIWHIGTSGYSYPAWKGSFYPDKLPAKQFLSYYATQFDVVEYNGSFRTLPSDKSIDDWATQTPAAFRFVLKAPQKITHIRRLKEAGDDLQQLAACVTRLKKRAAPVLFQLPPNFKQDLARLEEFLKHAKKPIQAAFEFRHESWLNDDTCRLLKKHKAALVVADAEDLPETPLVPTAGWGYLRLRRENYTDAALRKWIRRIEAMNWKEVFVFFKHEDTGTGPKLGQRLLRLTDSP